MSGTEIINPIEAWLSACFRIGEKRGHVTESKRVYYVTGKLGFGEKKNLGPLVDFIQALYYVDGEAARKLAKSDGVEMIKLNETLVAKLKLQGSVDGAEWHNIEHVDLASPPEYVAVHYEGSDFRLQIDPAAILSDYGKIRKLEDVIVGKLDLWYGNNDPYCSSYTEKDKLTFRSVSERERNFERVSNRHKRVFETSQEQRAESFFESLKQCVEDPFKSAVSRMTSGGRPQSRVGETETSTDHPPPVMKKVKTIPLSGKLSQQQAQEQERAREAALKAQEHRRGVRNDHHTHHVQEELRQIHERALQIKPPSQRPPGPRR